MMRVKKHFCMRMKLCEGHFFYMLCISGQVQKNRFLQFLIINVNYSFLQEMYNFYVLNTKRIMILPLSM